MTDKRLGEQDSRSHWDDNAPHWAELVRDGWDICREYINNPAMLEYLGDLSGKQVLDAGCGEGYNTRLLAQRGGKMTGVDLSAKMIELARREEKRQPLGIHYQQGSYSDLSGIAGESFDLVVLTMAMMDSPGYAEALREFHRVLRPAGELYFSITHPCFMTRHIGWLAAEGELPMRLTAAEYFNREPVVKSWRFGAHPDPDKYPLFTVPTFYRTLSEYINLLLESGFKLRHILEPRPTEEGCRKHPALERWRDHAALFLHIHAVKDEG